MASVGADFDNDGREDLWMGARDYADGRGLLFRQKPDHTFEDVSEAWKIDKLSPFRSAVVADFDRDGDLDFTRRSDLTMSDASEHGHWLLVRLAGDGKTANRTGIGARVTVRSSGEQLVKELQGGYGNGPMQHDTVLHFGLGACAMVESVTVRWPDGAATTQTFRRVETNRFIELRQGDPGVHEVKLDGR
jgi:hypothetical protein